MKPFPSDPRPFPVVSVAGMRAWEQASWQSGRLPSEVIAHVGLALTGWIRLTCRPGSRLLLLCGRGHNGDDVRAAVPLLSDFTCDSVDVCDPVGDLPAVVAALGRQPDLVVDGLFGIGLNRLLDSDWRDLIDRVNAAALPVVAMDVPSGLDADSGAVHGTAIRACWTLTVGAAKRGLIATGAAEYVGRLKVFADVGLLPWTPEICPPEAWIGHSGEFEGWPPARAIASHKGDFGHVCILAGSLGYHGAAVLAARAAMRARPGLVTVVTAPEVFQPVAAQLAAAMVRPWEPGMALPSRTTAVVAGPGLADPRIPGNFRDFVMSGWRTWDVPIVADASALDWLPPSKDTAPGVRVITPHAGEAARLLGTSVASVQADRMASLRRLSETFGGAWVVLKGQGTLVGRSRELPWWNPTGNAGLAQGGSGDVLAGFLGASLAQSAMKDGMERTLRGAVFRHGQAADRLEAGGEPWSAEDLSRQIRW